MKKAARQYLAEIPKAKALLPFHGFVDGKAPNIAPLIDLFPKWNVRAADRLWCAAFVYYCCIVLFDRVFENKEHDHIGIILDVRGHTLITAEGNVRGRNISGIVQHPMDEHIRAYIRIPNGYHYDFSSP